MLAVDWNAVGAISNFAVVVVALWAIRHEDRKGPKLGINFDKDRDVKEQGNTVGIDDPRRRSRWLRVRVVNGPRRFALTPCRAAKNCRAFLVGVEKVEPDGNVPKFVNDARQLSWMHDPPKTWAGRDLLPGIPQWADVASTVEGRAGVRLEAYPEDALDEPGDYLVTVQVSADEADPVTIQVLLHWGGTWDTLDGRPADPAAGIV